MDGGDSVPWFLVTERRQSGDVYCAAVQAPNLVKLLRRALAGDLPGPLGRYRLASLTIEGPRAEARGCAGWDVASCEIRLSS